MTATTLAPTRSAAPVTATTPRQLLQKTAAEAVGTFALVLAGCGAILVDHQGGAIGHLGVGLTFGLVITAMILATGHVSGAHLNPAVTLAFAALGRFPWRQVPAYVGGQCAAALAAAALLAAVVDAPLAVAATTPADAPWQALLVEVVITFLLMFVITSVATDARAVGALAGIAIGATVALAAIFAGPLSGASMNPARSLGPALVAGSLDALWIYVLGPVVGALLGAFAYWSIQCGEGSGGPAGCC